MRYSCGRLTVFSLGTPIWQRLTNVSCLRSYHSKKNRASFHPRSQNLSGEDSTWMVDCLKISRIVHCLFFYYMVDLLWLFQKMSCVLSCERENQIVVTISTFLHHIHVELEVTTPCLLSTVSVRYFLEMRA